MMTAEEKATFKGLFAKYCRQEINKGHCQEDCCDICPVNNAYDEIFYKFNDEEEEEA
jgi:hypothetical protein